MILSGRYIKVTRGPTGWEEKAEVWNLETNFFRKVISHSY